MVFRGEHDRRPDQASLARSSITSWPSWNGPYQRKLDASGVSRSSITFPNVFPPVRIPGQATQSKLNFRYPFSIRVCAWFTILWPRSVIALKEVYCMTKRYGSYLGPIRRVGTLPVCRAPNHQKQEGRAQWDENLTT